MMSKWLDIQRNLVKEELVAEIDVETITYTRVGGYKATPYSDELGIPTLLTAKSIKGVWRWWARTAIVAAFCGHINYGEAEEFLSKILGGAGEDKGASIYRVEVVWGENVVRNQINKSKEVLDKIDKFFNSIEKFVSKELDQLIRNIQVRNVKVCINPCKASVHVEPVAGDLNKLIDYVRKSSIKDYVGKVDFNKRGLSIHLKIDDELKDLLDIPRVSLILMRRGKEEVDEISSKKDLEKAHNYIRRVKEELFTIGTTNCGFKVVLYRNRSGDYDDFALSTLILSLILGGVGSITRRGFGSLRIKSVKLGAKANVSQNLQNVIRKLGIAVTKEGESEGSVKTIMPREQEIKSALDELCKLTIEYAEKINSTSCKQGQEKGAKPLPLVPSLNRIDIEVIECNRINLAEIGKAFLKERWKRNPREPGKDYDTWILGLPRSRGLETGYFIKTKDKRKPGRRISTIGVRVYSPSEGGSYVIIYGLPSRDWPSKLIHVGTQKKGGVPVIKNKNNIEQKVRTAYEKAMNNVKNIISGVCRGGGV